MSRHIGIVLIGRNEGARLLRCLDSIPFGSFRVVYVDSGSTDGSIEAARTRGAEVVELDPSQPFTAARARNAGLARLVLLDPGIDRIQFLDGDCSLEPGWLERASGALDADAGIVAVCGWRRELAPDSSLYNRLCDLEWRTAAPGESEEFGGDVMLRRDALEGVGGYDASRIAGEDPDLSQRLRARGGRILRLDATMTHHDADIRRWLQWWRRTVRAGFAYAANARSHPEGPFRRRLRGALLWAAFLPLAIGVATLVVGPWALLGAAVYPAQVLRIAWRTSERFSFSQRLLWGAACVASQLPTLVGAGRFERNRLLGRHATLIEYKGGRS